MIINKRNMGKERKIIFLCLFPIWNPVVITGTLDIIFNIGKIVSVVYCITTLMAKRKTRKYCKYIKYIVFFYLSYVLNTAINGGQVFRAFIDGITVIGFSLMFCTFAFSDSKRKFYQIAFDVYSVLLVINSISVILYPGGITALDTYFLGHDDTLLYWLILYIIFTFMYQQCCKNKKEILLVCTFVSGTSLLILKSISGILCMIIFILFYNIIGKSKKLLISSNIAVLVLNVGIVIFKIQKIFSFFIVNILHKSIDLTGREKIWNRVLYWVMQKPIMGYGYETSEILQKKFMLTDGSYFHFAHCHNFLLQITYTMGGIGLLIFLVIYFIAWKKMFENGINKWNRIVAALLLTLMISLIINSYQQPVALFILMIIGYDISKIGDAFHEAK